MKPNNNYKTICDRCAHYCRSPGGYTERCAVNMLDPDLLTRYYFEQRRDGVKNNCKSFKKLIEIRPKDMVMFY